MVGVLVQAQVRHHHRRVADLGVDVPQRHLDDAGRVIRRRAAAVLDRRDPEQDQPADSRLDRVDGRLAQAVPGVLDHPWHRPDGLRLADPLLDEHRQDKINWPDGYLRHQAPQRRTAPEPARARGGEACTHRRITPHSPPVPTPGVVKVPPAEGVSSRNPLRG